MRARSKRTTDTLAVRGRYYDVRRGKVLVRLMGYSGMPKRRVTTQGKNCDAVQSVFVIFTYFTVHLSSEQRKRVC